MRVLALFTCILCFSCSRTAYHGINAIRMSVDSIYIDEIENADTLRHLPMIIYFCTVKNMSDSVLDLRIRKYPDDKTIETNCYLMTSMDTIGLYLDAQPFVKIAPRGEGHFWLKTNTFGLIDLLESQGYREGHHPTVKGLNEVIFLKKMARESFILFEWRGYKKEIRDLEKIKINYRDPNNHTVD